MSDGRAISSTHSTWLATMRGAIRHSREADVSRQDWIDSLITAMASAKIKWMPGSGGGRLTSQHIVQLVGKVSRKQIIAGPAGSLKRASMIAEHEMEMEERQPKKARRRAIDFGCSIPFTMVPDRIVRGFAKLEKEFRKRKDDRVLNHYQVAHNCLVQGLGDPSYDVMLMLSLTMAASTETPQVAEHERHFSVGKSKDADMFAATLVTRMLWFIRPDAFLVKEDEREVLCIREMTKRIGEWVKVRRGVMRRQDCNSLLRIVVIGTT